MQAVDRAAAAAAVAGLCAAVRVVACGVLPPSSTVPAVLVPCVFLLAGLIGPVWDAARFTCRALVAIGLLHLVALAASATARVETGAAAGWHAASLLLYVAGFAVLLPLASGYPSGPSPRAATAGAPLLLLLPIAASFAGPTPAVLSGTRTILFGPLVPLLPGWVSSAAAAVFLAPLVAVGIAAARSIRGGREMRGRLLLPLIGLGAFATLLGLGVVLPSPQVSTALFLVAAPLIPAGLVLGARPLRAPLDDESTGAPEGPLEVLTAREREVLAAMADGGTNAAIAARLHLSVSAVEKHSSAIFTKLALPLDAVTHRRVAAVVAYLRATR